MLFLLNWKVVTREEIRINLPNLGMELQTTPHALPPIPEAPVQIPFDDSYPMTELHDVPEDVIAFIEENKIPEEVLGTLPDDSFGSVESLVRAIHELAETSTPQEGEE